LFELFANAWFGEKPFKLMLRLIRGLWHALDKKHKTANSDFLANRKLKNFRQSRKVGSALFNLWQFNKFVYWPKCVENIEKFETF
jgi:hypothetical protein